MAKGVTAFRKGLKDDGSDESSSDDEDSTRRESLGADASGEAKPRREDERAGS